MTDARRWPWKAINREKRRLYARAIMTEVWIRLENILMTKPDVLGAAVGIIFLSVMATVTGDWRPASGGPPTVLLAQSRQPEINQRNLDDLYRYVDAHDSALADHAKVMDAAVVDNIKQTNAVREDVAAIKSKVEWVLMIVGGCAITWLTSVFGPVMVRTRRKESVVPGGDAV